MTHRSESKKSNPTRGRPGKYAYAMLGAVLVAAYYAYGVIERFGRDFPGFDVFAYTHPNFLYARNAWEQGYGLLWNDLQNCGQPFFGVISTGLLNPVNFLSFVLDPDTALTFKVFVHFAIAGIGMVLLCREIGLGPLAAFCGALAFLLGGGCASIGRTTSAIIGAYVWLPAAAFLCERILRAPSPRAGVLLGVVLTLQLFGGFPQLLVFTYQWIVLRALFELATKRGVALGPTTVALALGLLLPPLLGAVQLGPSFDVLGESVRGRALSGRELNPLVDPAQVFTQFRIQLGTRGGGLGSFLPVVGIVLAGLAFVRGGARRFALFYLMAVGLYMALALSAPLFELYQQLPLGKLFRSPSRFLWMASLAISLLVACGVDSFRTRRHETGTSINRLAASLPALAGLVGFYFLSPVGFLDWEWPLLFAAVTACVAGVLFERGRLLAAIALPVLLAWNLHSVANTGSWIPGKPAATLPPVFSEERGKLLEKRWAFELVGNRRSEQDRMYQFGQHFDYSILAKSASVFGVPSITDYEPQTSRRYAEFFVRMLYDAPMTSLNQYYYRFIALPRNRALLDLVGARYLVVDTAAGEDPTSLRPRVQELERRGTLAVYENRQALPRAFYVPRVKVISDPAALLERLASGGHRPRRVGLLEEAPVDGFLGRGAQGTGSAEIIASRGEELEVRVQASAEGFLFVADQYDPGWTATVDGAPTVIHRANYAFRVVRVPEGDSTVEFRFRPPRLRAGIWISALTVVGLLLYAGLSARRGWYRSQAADAKESSD